jgi:DNA-binding protein HU-beta
MHVNLTGLIEEVSRRTGIAKSDAEAMVKATLDAIAEEVSRGGEVRLTNFGTFRLFVGEPRRRWNPATREWVKGRPRATRTPKFRASGTFRNDTQARKVVKTVAKAKKRSTR